MLAKRSEACVMTYVLVGLCVAVVVGIGGYVFGSRYEVKLHKRTRVEILDEEDDEKGDNYDDYNRR